MKTTENIFRIVKKKLSKKANNVDDYKIYILSDLHEIEFDAVLAHEYLHVWQNNYNIYLYINMF